MCARLLVPPYQTVILRRRPCRPRRLRFRLALSRTIAGRRRSERYSSNSQIISERFTSVPFGDALQLLNSGGDRARYWFAAGALMVGFGLGWAGSSSWYGSPTIVVSNPIIQKDTTYRRPEMKSADKIESVRTQSTLGTGTHSRTATAAFPPDISLPTGSMAVREAMLPTPETRPTTIEGWTVRDVRGGTVVLEGPDGIRTAVAGDTVPGVGRIDSIVRWGNRWIVATANGLIATP